MGKPITGFIQDVIRNQITKDSTVESVPKTFIDYFSSLPEIPDTHFIVAGYENQTQKQKIYKVDIKNKSSTLVNTDSQGATWDGEITTLVRLIQDVAIKMKMVVIQLCHLKTSCGTISHYKMLWILLDMQLKQQFKLCALKMLLKLLEEMLIFL